MKAHVLQHVAFEDIGSIASWLEARSASISRTQFFKNDALPSLNDLDLVVIMGGPMSANDESTLPWLCREKQFIHEVIRRGIPVVGICLGAQLIAAAVSSSVYRNAHKEIGWFPVSAASSGAELFHMPRSILAFHWHGETFDLPQEAILLAKSEGCENQAFQIGRNVIGLQFHLETTPECMRSLIRNCRSDLSPGKYVQTEEELQKPGENAYPQINALMSEVLSFVTRDSR